jgi:ParB-like chromosome segregation protein Spo0J
VNDKVTAAAGSVLAGSSVVDLADASRREGSGEQCDWGTVGLMGAGGALRIGGGRFGGGVIRLPLAGIKPPTFSLRLNHPDQAYVAALAETATRWEPIVVLAADRSIVDGYHRYLAAQHLGHTYIGCRVFTASPDEAYLEALRLNSRQGQILTLRERKRAACYVLTIRQQWSDRRIAELCGLSPTTVARLRANNMCPSVQSVHLDTRVGRDDRVRPVDRSAVRRRITEELITHSDASLREIARTAKCSPETVRSLRDSLQGVTAIRPPPSAQTPPEPMIQGSSGTAERAFVSTNEGAAFLAWFSRTQVDQEECRGHATHVPLSRIYEVADAARRRSDAWSAFARALESRARSGSR